MHERTRIMMEATIFAALSLLLSMVPTNIGSSLTVSLGMIPLTIFALRRGLKAGLIAAFIWGILHFPMGNVFFLSVPQVLIEYPIAFTFAGFAGLFSDSLKQALIAEDSRGVTRSVILGSFAGSFARFFWHFVAGVVFWGSYAVWGMGPVLFSFVTNGINFIATGTVTSIVIVIIAKKTPQLFLPKSAAKLEKTTN